MYGTQWRRCFTSSRAASSERPSRAWRYAIAAVGARFKPALQCTSTLARLHEAGDECHDLAEARAQVALVAVGHGDAVEGESVLAVGALERAEPEALAR